MASFTDWNQQEGFEAFPGDFVWSVTGRDVQVIRAEVAPGTDFGLHSHQQEQIICVLAGQLEFTVDGETRIVGPGQVIHAPSGVEHGGRAVSDDPVITLEAFSPPRVNFSHNQPMVFEDPV